MQGWDGRYATHDKGSQSGRSAWLSSNTVCPTVSPRQYEGKRGARLYALPGAKPMARSSMFSPSPSLRSVKAASNLNRSQITRFPTRKGLGHTAIRNQAIERRCPNTDIAGRFLAREPAGWIKEDAFRFQGRLPHVSVAARNCLIASCTAAPSHRSHNNAWNWRRHPFVSFSGRRNTTLGNWRKQVYGQTTRAWNTGLS
jgi:hypothetical protein